MNSSYTNGNNISVFLSSTRDVAYSQLRVNGITRDRIEKASRLLSEHRELWAGSVRMWKELDGDKAAVATWVLKALELTDREPVVTRPDPITPSKSYCATGCVFTSFTCWSCGMSFEQKPRSVRRKYCGPCLSDRNITKGGLN